MKKLLTVMVAVMVLVAMTVSPVEAKAVKHVKVVKGSKVVCPYCIDGKHKHCPYWYIDVDGVGKHMTPKEIEEFCEMEMR